MKILAIDSSNTTMSLALCEDTSLIGAVTNTVNRNHSTSLMPALVELCASSNIKPTELDRIVVAQGPGSYTGLRIGVTTAKTLAWTLGIDLVGISSLATLAANGVDYQGFLVPLFDARRQNVYSGVYQWQDGQLVTILADRHISLASWLAELKQLDGEIRFIGRDQNQFKAEIIAAFSESSLTTSPQLNEVNALALAQLGLQARPVENTVDFIPVYLKLVEAEENWLAENQAQAGQVYVEKSSLFTRVRELFKVELHYGEKIIFLNELKFLIREVRYMDIKKLIAIERQVYQGEVPWGRSAFLEELNGPNPILYILAIHETEIVGFMGIRFENGDGHITNVAVLEKYQNNGLGRFFLKEGERVARENNYRSLSLEVRVSNLDAQRLYRRLGFVAQRIKPNYYRNNKEDAVDMLYLFEEQADVEK